MVSIIIPSFKRTSILYRTLHSMQHFLNEFEGEIIVVDDNKDEDLTFPFHHSKLRLVKNPGKGVASARNFGLSQIRYDLVIFLDDDMLITLNHITTAVEFISKNPTSCLNFNWTYPPDLLSQIDQTKFGRYLVNNGHADLKGWMGNEPWVDQSIFEVKWLTSQFLAIRKSDVLAMGGYNENFPFAGFEDRDFSIRLSNAGIKIYLNTMLTIYHNEEDRVTMNNWLTRRFRNGLTRAIGVTKFGYQEYALNYSSVKSIIFNVIYGLAPVYKLFLWLIPNMKLFDKLFTFWFNPLLGAYIHRGYKRGLTNG